MTMISPMSRSNAFQRLITSLRASTLGRSVKVLSRNDQRKVVVITGVQVFLSLLDLLGVAAVGMLGALAVRGIQFHKKDSFFSQSQSSESIIRLDFTFACSTTSRSAVKIITANPIFINDWCDHSNHGRAGNSGTDDY